MTMPQIIDSFKQKAFKPIYLFHGEESYFTDVLIQQAENLILDESEKAFNQAIFYGKDIDLASLLNEAKRYPMMSDYQLIIVKEAQDLKWNGEALDVFENYLKNPLKSTILIFGYKNGKFDSRKKVFKLIEKVGLVLESKMCKEAQLYTWIQDYVKERDYKIESNTQRVLVEYLGNSLSKIANELDKLMLNLAPKSEITTTLVQKYVGISKDFNVFEYQKALASRNVLKANQISRYFAGSAKEHPIQMIVASLYSFYTKILKYHLLTDKSQAASILGVAPFIVKEYEHASKSYSIGKLCQIVSYLREYDLKSKGLGSGQMTLEDLWKEFTFKLIH